jgi:hypothetical protein
MMKTIVLAATILATGTMVIQAQERAIVDVPGVKITAVRLTSPSAARVVPEVKPTFDRHKLELNVPRR